MTAASRQAYGIDLNLYQQRKRDFHRQRDRIASLKEWVRQSVSDHHLRTACAAKDPIHIWYENLKEGAGVTVEWERLAIQREYRAAIKPLDRPPKDIIAWIKSWEQALARAKEAKVPDALDTVV
jgi:hypothetical protein